MADRTSKPKTLPKKAQLKDLKTNKADKIKGGAYEFYVRLEGTKQGKFK
jgi:hypothetical protein